MLQAYRPSSEGVTLLDPKIHKAIGELFCMFVCVCVCLYVLVMNRLESSRDKHVS